MTKQKQFKSWAIVYDAKLDGKNFKTVPSIWARFTPDGYQLLKERLPSLIILQSDNVKNYRIEPSLYDLDEQEGKPPVKNNYSTT
jgi:hypothetical protein|tara:strand:+ start:243 stop:497 length:255 start_codon:yes stop_codon:yes gene_type:complete